MEKSRFSFRKRISGFRYAFRGIWLLICSEHNAWIHCLAAICVLLAGLFFQLTSLEWIIIIGLIGAVLAAEAFNTAIEKIADLVSPNYNEMIKHAKDLAAGGVLIIAIAAAIIGIIIFVPHIINLFSSL